MVLKKSKPRSIQDIIVTTDGKQCKVYGNHIYDAARTLITFY